MNLTEEEARTKWCPHIRLANMISQAEYAVSVNVYDNLDRPRCIASECSQWRWQPLMTKGYCGLAGKPEA